MELKLVKRLSPFALEKLYELLATNNTPYQIALLDFLGFIRHYERNFATTRKDLYDALADILSTSNRTVQGNINVLMPSSKADKERFTAHNFKEKVEKDYQNLD